MKHTLLILPVLFSLSLMAQVPNGGMENWTTYPPYNYDAPDGWTTINSLTIGFSKQTCQKEASAYAGTFAAKLVTVNLFGTQNAPGLLTTGKVNSQTSQIYSGVPINHRPTNLKGYFKYHPAANDTAGIEIYLSKAGVRIGSGSKSIGDSVKTWTAFDIAITYTSADVPDTVLIVFNSSATDAMPVGSTFWIDDLTYEPGGTDITETTPQYIGMYPNPVVAGQAATVRVDGVINSNAINFKVFDITGKLVHQQNNEVNNAGQYSINTSTLAAGEYICTASAGQQVIGTSKLSIQ